MIQNMLESIPVDFISYGGHSWLVFSADLASDVCEKVELLMFDNMFTEIDLTLYVLLYPVAMQHGFQKI